MWFTNPARDAREYVLHPLDLVVRGSATYLVASVKDYDAPLHFALHRFISANLSPRAVRIPQDFRLRKILQDKAFGYPMQDDSIRLIVLFTAQSALHLYETPRSEDQTIEDQSDGRKRLTATVMDTLKPRNWLLGFGTEVEIIEPQSLRVNFLAIAQGLYALYGGA